MKPRCSRKGYRIYFTTQEADADGIQYKHWKECEVGDWGLTDEGQVVQCKKKIKVIHRPGIERYCFTFGGSTIWSNMKHFGYGSANRRINMSIKKRKALVKLVALSVINNNFIVDNQILKNLYKGIYNKELRNPTAWYYKHLSKEKFMDQVTQEIEDICIKRGLTKEYIIDKLKSAIDIAEEDRNSIAMIQGVKVASPLLNMTNNSLEIKADYSVRRFDEAKIIEEIDNQQKKIAEIN